MGTLIRRQPKGFTIIEVLIVLAIAGLIMVVVFVAVPQLQRNTRDNTRQSVATRIASELETYAGNNQGSYPFSGAPGTWPASENCPVTTGGSTGSCQDWAYRYLSGGSVNINDPSSGNRHNLYISTNATLPAARSGNVYIAVGYRCSGDNITSTGSSRNYAVVVGLERDGTRFCVDNS